MAFTLDFLSQIRAVGLPEPQPEYVFAPPRRLAFDWAWPEAKPKLALEIEGGIYGLGRPCPLCGRKAVGAHTSVQRLLSDMEKYNLAAVLAWRVLRATPEQVASGEALAWVERALRGAEEVRHG